MTVIDMTDHEHCLRAKRCWQASVPCPSLNAERRTNDDGEPISAMTQCGVCGRWWDDAIPTSLTPVPAGRCPFEYEHGTPPEGTRMVRVVEQAASVVNYIYDVPVPVDVDTQDYSIIEELLDREAHLIDKMTLRVNREIIGTRVDGQEEE